MGIKGIRDLIKRQFETVSKTMETPPVFEETVPISSFAYKKIVVDAAIFVCTYKAVQRELYEESFINMLTTLREANVEVVFVFDGTSPDEKTKEKQRRVDSKKAQYERVERLEEAIRQYKRDGIITPELQEINDKKVPESKLRIRLTTDKPFSLLKVEAHVRKIRSSILEITPQDFSRLEELLTIFGVPYITAPGEGEVLCAELVKQGKADAVLTRDTDVLACGVPTMLSNINLSTKEFTMIKMEHVLKCFDLDYDSWLDLCIMCGTDYNNNLPKIGPVRALALIQKHKRLEQVSLHMDTTILTYENVRSLFKVDTIPDELPFCSAPDFDKIAERIVDRQLRVSPNSIRRRLDLTPYTGTMG